jgi:hypothetical protein
MNQRARVDVNETGRRAAVWRWVPLLMVGIVGSLGLSACGETAKPPAQTAASAPVVAAPAGPEAGPPVTIVPAAAARPVALGTISIGSFDRLLENGVKLVGSAVPLPMTASGVRDMLFSEAGLPPEVAVNLDLASPIGAVVVALEGKRTSLVVAVPARGPAEAEKLIDALGKRVMTRPPLTLVATSGKSQSWVYRSGNVVVLGDEIDGLARGAMLALEARRPGPDDVTATLFPDAIAKANGTDVKTAIAGFLEQVRQAQQASAEGGTPPDAYAYETLGQILNMAGDADPIEVGLSLDPARGLVLRGRLLARPGSTLATAAREVRPFEIDPVVLGGQGAPFVVGAMSIGTFWGQMLAHNRARLAAQTGKPAAAALGYYDAFLAAQAGEQSGSIAIAPGEAMVSGLFSTALKPGSADKVSGALAKLDSKAMDALFSSQLQESSKLFDWTSKRETVGKAKAVRFRVSVKKGSTFDTDVTRRLLGKGIDVYQAVVGNRLIVAFGQSAKARLADIAAGKVPAAATAAAALTDAQAAAKGRDAFYFFDFAPLLRVIGQLGSSPRLAALAHASSGPIPLIFTGGGDGAGKVWSMDLTLTATAFNSVGALISSGVMSAGK